MLRFLRVRVYEPRQHVHLEHHENAATTKYRIERLVYCCRCASMIHNRMYCGCRKVIARKLQIVYEPYNYNKQIDDEHNICTWLCEYFQLSSKVIAIGSIYIGSKT